MIGLAAVLITGRTIENLATLKIGNLGDVIVLLATLGWAIVAVSGKRLTKVASSVVIGSFRFIFVSTIFLPLVVALNQLVIKSIYQVVLG